MANQAASRERCFKTSSFAKATKKSQIADRELCLAIQQVMLGQADDLGGGIFKKRLGKNMYRSIILARGKQLWVYEYLFAKKDRANISEEELTDFRRLAKIYATLSDSQIAQLIRENDWVEICNPLA